VKVVPSTLSSLSSPHSGVATPNGDASGGTTVRALPTFSCADCGRNFKRGSLMKHQKVCKKVFRTKRAAFDSSLGRTQEVLAAMKEGADDDAEEGEDGEDAGEEEGEEETVTAAVAQKQAFKVVSASFSGNVGLGGGSSKSKASEEMKEQLEPVDKNSWKDQSESLREAMRQAKKSMGANTMGGNSMGIDMRAMMPKRK
jgi:hypothetical protein